MTFLQSIESFLLELRDSYGFLIPVDRLAQCLTCAEDITDVEEVFYRLQSMVCSSQEQTDAFRSLFARRLLKSRPKPHIDAIQSPTPQKSNPGESPEKRQRSLDTSANSLNNVARLKQQLADEAQTRLEESRQKLLEQDALMKKYMTENTPISDTELEEKKDAACPDLEYPALAAQLKSTLEAVDKAAKAAAKEKLKTPIGGEEAKAAVRAALASPYYKDLLEEMTRRLLEAAGKCRGSGGRVSFAAFLEAIDAVNKLIPLAGKSIPATAKKGLQAAEKQLREFRKQTANLDKSLTHARSEVASMERQFASRAMERDAAADRARAAAERAEAFRRETEAQQQAGSAPKLIVKETARSHRSIFEGGINAVQTTAEQAALMETDLQRMTPAAKQTVLSFIRANARVFRQTLRRKYASHSKRQVDIRATVRAASRTGGEPAVIKYRRPAKSHAKVMILTDISGSCRRTATLALYFMAMMDEAFPGGCRKFAFVNSLEPVDKYFRDKGPDDGIQALLSAIPTRGVYSDYGTTIHQFRKAYGGTVHKDTTVIILGDARNNRRPSYAEDLKYIASRCRKVFWLDPEPEGKWDTGDSIIGEYAGAGAEARRVGTVGDLLKFLSNIT